MRDEKKINKDLKNGIAYDNPSNIATSLIKKLKSTLIIKLISRSGESYLLDILLSDSNFKIICNYIHLLLPLNQLKYLVVKKILDHAIRDKEKIYFESNQ